MAKKMKKTKKSSSRRGTNKKDEVVEEEEEGVERLTLEAIDAISSEEDSDADNDNEDDEWNAEARALRQAIADGAFDKLIKKNEQPLDEEEEEEEISSDEENNETNEEEQKEDGNDSSSEDEEDKLATRNNNSHKALVSVTEMLLSEKRKMPWAEKFDVVAKDDLPFQENKLIVHDDLKREYAFYNMAVDAVTVARSLCEESSIPFSRPDDFFAEMVKTDDHMAKVKDRLIFETKKMDAFQQRKQNKEFKLHEKEKRAHKLAEKSKQKRLMLEKVEGYKKSHRGGTMDDDDDDQFMGHLDGNKKRQASDRKFGFGGKRGRFKQTDKKSLNDMSGFNPKGNFASGTKGKKRQGKRARDASRR
eukprot:CAMPEP_0195292144 /NCGR_PEP_ID=MMETSP0707-20130614/8640_1 /TAXON_ID=33640 /ORGANISM="Asterionellopsis glacialis, Strain CCMP134" /LENGTH=360 /DNA_ID=CAMNT_0040352541 /DNA_START=48 /DNA_END=1130 /DNA_ORIENTATION=+